MGRLRYMWSEKGRVVIELSCVDQWFGGVRALRKVSLTVSEKQFVTLIGPSGCGKTTVLRLVAGLIEPTEGKVQVGGGLPCQACERREIGLAFQQPALVPSLTALENVELTLKVTQAHKNGLSPRKLLDEFGLGEFLNHYPHQLSGGMQQRVNIACAMVHNPLFLLLDEPFGALDAITRERMGTWLSQILQTTTKTVLFVTHSVEEAVFLSGRIVILSPRPGEVAAVLDVSLPWPRIRTRPMFIELVKEAREILDGCGR